MIAWILVGLAIGADEPGSLLAGSVELLSDEMVFSEGPLWLPDGRWIFSDIPQDAIFLEDGTVYHRGTNETNGMTLDPDGRLLMCQADRVVRVEADGSQTVIIDEYYGKPLNSPNDIIVRSDGLILFTDPQSLRERNENGETSSNVYSILPDGSRPRVVANDLKYPNGIGLSPDERTLYVGDTSGGVIVAYDLSADGSGSNGRTFAEVRIPDGMAVDRDGRVWTSSSRGIVVLAPDGAFVERVEFQGMPTNCAFGGEDGHTLFITARKRVYKVRTKVRGIVAAHAALQSIE